jgi:(4-(4-[2-(gamma-L-glutamylamino)ethyl]phenoxymethyl)furan-2-yl)methanamine synthase
MSWLALDIGGANIKVADGKGFAISSVFPLWKKPKQLADALRTLIAGAPKADHLAATMSGELADCFTTKAEGVQAIIQAFVVASDGRHVRIYFNNGTLVAPQIALKQPLLAAAANWHALAMFAGRYVPMGAGLAIDIGSTTCDIVPLVDGVPTATATTDPERLAAGELVYTGVERSPVCALVNSLPWRKQQCPVAHEFFATTWDAYLTLGDLPEEPQSTHTADGRPATKQAARDRLARTICADREMFSDADASAAAEAIARSQLAKIAVAAGQVLGRLPAPPATIVISGRGEFLARRVLERMKVAAKIVSLAEELGPAPSRCAPAHALAVLAREAYASEG